MKKATEKSLQIVKYLPTKLVSELNNLTYPDKMTTEMCYVISYVIFRSLSTNQTEAGEDGEEYVEISKTMFVNAIGDKKLNKKSLYLSVLEFLEENKIISIIANSFAGVRCNSYKLTDSLYDGTLTKVIISDEYLKKQTKKIIDESKKDNDKRKVKMTYSNDSWEWIKSMRYDSVKALDYLETIYSKKVPYKGKILSEKTKSFLTLKINLLEMGNSDSRYRTMSISQTNGRVMTDISDLRKDFRQFIKGDDLVILDIPNSQPLLLNVLMDYILDPLSYPTLEKFLGFIFDRSLSYKKSRVTKDTYINALKGITISKHKQLEEFRKVTDDGKFYEYFQDWYWRNDYDKYEANELYVRDNMKKVAFQMFYMDWTSRDLNAVFPYVNKFVDSIKKVFVEISNTLEIKAKKCRLFAVSMQAIESLLWVQSIQTLLDEKKIKYYGIHDSVMVERADKDRVLSIIKKVYNDYKINPDINPEDNNFSLLTKKEKKKDIKKARIGIEVLFEASSNSKQF